eukprot:6482088-Amphidinium_carterae.4
MGVLRYCCELLALDTPSAMFQHMCELPLVTERWFEELLGGLKTRRGSEDFMMCSVAGAWPFLADQLLSPLSSEFASRVRLSKQLVDAAGASYVQSKTWELNVRFVGELALSMCLYQNPPFGFLRLLSGSAEQVERELAALRGTWSRLRLLEQKAHTDAVTKDYLHQMTLQTEVYVRETFVRLEERLTGRLYSVFYPSNNKHQEANWRVTLGIRRSLEGLRDSIHSTLAIENMFNTCRRAQAATANHTLSATAAFYHTAQSSFLAEYDRCVPTASATTKLDVAGLPEWDHDSTSCALVHAASRSRT